MPIGSGLQGPLIFGAGPLSPGTIRNLIDLGWAIGGAIFGATAQATFIDPNMRLFGTHYCGPGGGGSLSSLNPQLDAACKAHDKCFTLAGADMFTNIGGYSAAVQECNQKLCNAASQAGGVSGDSIVNYFSHGPNACH